MPVTENFHVNFTASTERLSRAGRLAVQSLGRVAAMAGRATLALAGIGGIGAAGGIAKLSLDAERLDVASRRLGVSPFLVRLLERMAELTPGLDLQDMIESINELDRIIGEGKFDIFERLGLGERSVRSLQERPLDLLAQVLDRAAKLRPGEQVDILGKLFGEDLGLKLQALQDVKKLVDSQLRQEIGARGQLMGEAGTAPNLTALREMSLNIGALVDQVFRNLSQDGGVASLIDEIKMATDGWIRSLGGAAGITAQIKDALESAAELARDLVGGPTAPGGRFSSTTEAALARAFPGSTAIAPDALTRAMGGTAPELYEGSLLQDAVEWLREIATNTAKGASFR